MREKKEDDYRFWLANKTDHLCHRVARKKGCVTPVGHVAGLIPFLFLSGLFSFVPRSWPAAITEPMNTSIMQVLTSVVSTPESLTGGRQTHQACRARVPTI